jgi:hypothetical protein
MILQAKAAEIDKNSAHSQNAQKFDRKKENNGDNMSKLNKEILWTN